MLVECGAENIARLTVVAPILLFMSVSSTHVMEAMMENDEGHPLNGPFPTD